MLSRRWKKHLRNTDCLRSSTPIKGSQFTAYSLHRRGALARNRSVHGRQGAWRDNVFVERLWRSVKYEEVYLKAYESVGQARSRSQLPDVVQVCFILPNLAMCLINLESPVVSLVLWGIRAVHVPWPRVRRRHPRPVNCD